MDSPLPDSEVPKAAPFKFDMADTCLDCLKKVEPLLADIGQYIHDHPDMVRGTDFEDRFNKWVAFIPCHCHAYAYNTPFVD